jgi:hypothetical protein
MIKTIMAWTNEVDDVEVAVSDILAQLEKKRLGANSIGIVSCFADFIGSGVVSALAGRLPFPIAGTTTMAASANGVLGEAILILTVLSSDDVEFEAGITAPITGEDAAPLKAAWDKIARPEKPALMLSFCPLMNNVSADFFVESLSEITGNVPNFGTLAVDHNTDYHEAQTIWGKESYRDRYVFILFYGKFEPRFFIGGISEERAFRERGVVTSAQGNLIKEVNGVSVIDYLVSLGLEKDENGVIQGINAFPFILDYNDGTQPVIRVIFAFDSDGSAICGGRTPQGATITVGLLDAAEVMKTTTAVLKEAHKSSPEDSSFLIFSCAGRYFAQEFNTTAEMDKVQEILGDRPFHLCISGTELCPVHGKDGTLTNRGHNNTIVICAL